MIDFRYHLVSIVAIILALGLGILIGTSLVPGAAERALQGTVQGLQGRLRTTRTELTDARRERDRAAAQVDQLSEGLMRNALAGRRFVVVSDGGAANWRDGVRDGLVAAGAAYGGALTITERAAADDTEVQTELASIVGLPAPSPGADLAAEALARLGTMAFRAEGQDAFVRAAAARFVRFEGTDPRSAWPFTPGTLVVAMGGAYREDSPVPERLAAFARGVATESPALVVSGSPADHSAATILRGLNDLPPALSTFDAGAERAGPFGVVMAARSAYEGRPGHFGAGDGLRFFPPAA